MNNKESRLQNSILNIKTVWIWQFVYFFVKFFTRKLFTQYISAEYLGLDGLFNNIIGLLGLAELGFGTALSYSLYKPLAEDDSRTILGIMQLIKKVYKYMALFILVLGLGIMPFLTLISPEITGLDSVGFTFILYIFSSCASYLFAYKSMLLTADQKNYLYIRNHYMFIILMNIAQLLSVVFGGDFLCYVAIQTFFTICEGISVSKITDRMYPFIVSDERITLPTEVTDKIKKDVKAVAIWKIGYQVIGSTDNVVLSKIVGLCATGLYNNYSLITQSLLAIVRQFPNAMVASIGNIVANDEKKKEEDIFWWTFFLNTSLFCFTAVCLANLIQPFILYWVGGDYLMNYSVALTMVLVFWITGIRDHLMMFKVAHGAFLLEAKKAIFEALTNLILSVLLAWKVGVLGVVLGTVFSAIFIGQPMELYNIKMQVRFSVIEYYIELGKYAVASLLVLFISNQLCAMTSMHWYIKLPLGVLISASVYTVIWIVCFGRKKEFRNTVALMMEIIRKKR